MVDIQPQSEQTTEDQELANVLAGITDVPPASAPFPTVGNLSPTGDLPELPTIEPSTDIAPTMPDIPTPDIPVETVSMPAPELVPDPVVPTMPSVEATFTAPVSSGLDAIKSNIINDLRPIVGKLNLPPEDKFNTYLLLTQSINDQEFIQPAYDAAREITDETKRAEALLAIIKKIEDLTKAQS
jgi:hypothetical protein